MSPEEEFLNIVLTTTAVVLLVLSIGFAGLLLYFDRTFQRDEPDVGPGRNSRKKVPKYVPKGKPKQPPKFVDRDESFTGQVSEDELKDMFDFRKES